MFYHSFGFPACGNEFAREQKLAGGDWLRGDFNLCDVVRQLAPGEDFVELGGGSFGAGSPGRPKGCVGATGMKTEDDDGSGEAAGAGERRLTPVDVALERALRMIEPVAGTERLALAEARGRILASWTPPPVDEQRATERPAKSGTLTMREALYYVLSLPVSTVVIGCDSVE